MYSEQLILAPVNSYWPSTVDTWRINCLRIVTGYVTGYARSAGLTLGRGVVVPFRHISAEASPAAWPIAHPDGVCPVLCTVSVVCCMGRVRSDLRGFVQHLTLPDLESRRETGQTASTRPLRGGQNYAVYASIYGVVICHNLKSIQAHHLYLHIHIFVFV